MHGLRKDKQPQIELQLCASQASATWACFDAERPPLVRSAPPVLRGRRRRAEPAADRPGPSRPRGTIAGSQERVAGREKPTSRAIDVGLGAGALGGIRTPNLLIRRHGGVLSGPLRACGSRSAGVIRQSGRGPQSGPVAVTAAVRTPEPRTQDRSRPRPAVPGGELSTDVHRGIAACLRHFGPSRGRKEDQCPCSFGGGGCRCRTFRGHLGRK